MFRVCLAGSYPAGTFQEIRQALSADRFEMIEAVTQAQFDEVTDADAVILRILKMPCEAFTRFTNLKMVMRWGTGYDSVDIEEAGRRGIIVSNTPGINAFAVAELVIAFMINLSRHVFGYFQNTQNANWDRNAFSNSQSLNQKKVGLIGGGNIGRQVAQKAQVFGVQVQYFDVCRLKPETEETYGMTYVDFDTLIATSDIISLHLPLLDSTRHTINVEQLARMKKGALLINAARGGLVDDEALLDALKSGHLGGAGLDCVENEESATTYELGKTPNVLITPHIGGCVCDLGSMIVPVIVENLIALEAGRDVANIVNEVFLQTKK
jgi:phosphoglycerate dehydrogenase-like enzyme